MIKRARIEIDVKGMVGTGKTTLIHLIEKTLRENGFDVKVNDLDEMLEDSVTYNDCIQRLSQINPLIGLNSVDVQRHALKNEGKSTMNMSEKITEEELKSLCEQHGSYLNQGMALRRGLSYSEVLSVIRLHKERDEYREKMKLTNAPAKLKQLASEITCIDFELQDAWRFGRDETHHRFWEVPKCECPSMDNAERLGTPYKIITSSCPVHGEIKTADKEDCK